MKHPAVLCMAVAASLLALLGPAHATGNFLCEIDDPALTFTAESTFSHGLGERFTAFAGAGRVLLTEAPGDLADLKVDGNALVHHWFAGNELKLHLYREREGEAAHGYVELIVDTKRTGEDDETAFVGTYSLVVHDMGGATDGDGRTLKANGRASCSVG